MGAGDWLGPGQPHTSHIPESLGAQQRPCPAPLCPSFSTSRHQGPGPPSHPTARQPFSFLSPRPQALSLGETHSLILGGARGGGSQQARGRGRPEGETPFRARSPPTPTKLRAKPRPLLSSQTGSPSPKPPTGSPTPPSKIRVVTPQPFYQDPARREQPPYQTRNFVPPFSAR